MRWLCLHFPWLALELHGLDPAQPQALLDSRQRILLENPAARALGVQPGQALATALALSPDLSLLETSEIRLQTELARLGLWAGAFSARISLLPPQALLLEIASMLHYFGGVEALLDRVRAALDETGYRVRLALGEHAQGAELLAAVDNWIDADPECWRQRLGQLRIDQLQLPARQLEQLRASGLSTLEELLQLAAGEPARSELARRFGQPLLQRLDCLAGRRQVSPPLFTPPEQFSQGLELAAEVTHSQGLLFPLRRLLAALEGFLQQRQQKASLLELLLIQRDGAQQTLTLGHAGGTASASRWLELCRLQFERTPLQAPVLALALRVTELQAQTSVSQDLFAPTRAVASADELLSRLRSRLGPDAVQTLSVHADHRPERVLAGEGVLAPTQGGPASRPGWLLAQPSPLSRAQCRRLQLLSGPERICSGWWDQVPDARPARRDYFVARWPDGRCGWLFRDAGGSWYLHGWFG